MRRTWRGSPRRLHGGSQRRESADKQLPGGPRRVNRVRSVDAMTPETRLRVVKAIHTLVWAVFAGAIVAIPLVVAAGDLKLAWGLVAFVLLEVAVLLANGMRCPLTAVAARYTAAREPNFDIYLPLWLARHNKEIFGALYVAGIVFTAWKSLAATG